ncbi:MAG: hypothetical protein ACLSGC_09250 [Bifidobacterium pseudocatenulatum]
MLASPTALKDYLFADSEAEYQLEHNVPVDISRRELSAPAGARYLRKPDENEDRPHGAVGPRAFVMPLDVDQMNLGPRFSARTRFRLPTPGLERSHAAYVASLVDVTGSQDE